MSRRNMLRPDIWTTPYNWQGVAKTKKITSQTVYKDLIEGRTLRKAIEYILLLLPYVQQ